MSSPSSGFTQGGLKTKAVFEPTGMLHRILSNEDYALALTPGFFRFYGHIGVLKALEETGCLRPSAVSGASAGALVGGFLAAGLTPAEMIKAVLEIKRADIWDVGGVGGLLKGELFQELVSRNLPVQLIEECKYPLAVTTYDLLRFKTLHLTKGNLAQAMCTSCTFPGMFQPVMIEGSPNIDGGVFDGVGLMALPHALGLEEGSCARSDGAASAKPSATKRKQDSSKSAAQLVVNVVFGRSSISSSVLPPQLKSHKLLTVVVENVPMVHPFSMDTMGFEAYKVARAATLKALCSSHMQELTSTHWCCYVDGQGVDPEDYPLPAPITPPSRENVRSMLLKRASSDDSSAESVAIDHTWSTAAARRSKRKLNASVADNDGEGVSNKRISTRSSRQSLPDAQSETRSASSEGDSSEGEGGSDSDEEGESRVSRRGFMSIPSFSFLNGTYRFYDAALHSIEDAGNAIYHDASSALNSAGKSVSKSSTVLYKAVRDTVEAVVHEFDELVTPDDADEDVEGKEVLAVAPVTPRRRAKANTSAVESTSVRKSSRKSTAAVKVEPVSPERSSVSKSKETASTKKVRSSKRS